MCWKISQVPSVETVYIEDTWRGPGTEVSYRSSLCGGFVWELGPWCLVSFKLKFGHFCSIAGFLAPFDAFPVKMVDGYCLYIFLAKSRCI